MVKIRIMSIAKQDQHYMFAHGEFPRQFLFVERPNEKKAGEFFDYIYTIVMGGYRVDAYALQIGGNRAILDAVTVEQTNPWLEKLIATPNFGKAVPELEMFNAIYLAKEAQSAIYGRHDYNDQKMQAILLGEPLKILKADSLSRDIARLLLETREPTAIHGKNHSIAAFPDIDNARISASAKRLEDAGLLEHTTVPSRHYTFESELVKTSELADFSPNQRLRKILAQVLEPYSSERPQYTHSLEEAIGAPSKSL
jgi:hypothetical protein